MCVYIYQNQGTSEDINFTCTMEQLQVKGGFFSPDIQPLKMIVNNPAVESWSWFAEGGFLRLQNKELPK